MKTITKTFNIYEFEELSPVIQEELIKKEEENIRQCDIENFLEEEMYNLAELLLEENFGENAIWWRKRKLEKYWAWNRDVQNDI